MGLTPITVGPPISCAVPQVFATIQTRRDSGIVIIFMFQKQSQSEQTCAISHKGDRRDGRELLKHLTSNDRWQPWAEALYIIHYFRRLEVEVEALSNYLRQFKPTLMEFAQGRRPYESYDLDFTEFVKKRLGIQQMSKNQSQKIKLRAKTKYNTIAKMVKKNNPKSYYHYLLRKASAILNSRKSLNIGDELWEEIRSELKWHSDEHEIAVCLLDQDWLYPEDWNQEKKSLYD